MNRKSILLMIIIVGMATVFAATGIFAGTKVKDDVKMENKAYKKHKKGIVVFSHKKHAEGYKDKNLEFYKNGCGECHHDDDNKPLDLKYGDDVQNCMECHKKPSERPKGKGVSAADKKKYKKKSARLEFHAEAIHYNCKGCHKKYNKKNKTKAAPTTCAKCHPKKK